MAKTGGRAQITMRWLNVLMIVLMLFGQMSPVVQVSADPLGPQLAVTPITWNVVGLDSNNVYVGPNLFPVGARACNTGDADVTNLTSQFTWEDATNEDYIYLRPLSSDRYDIPVTLTPGSCKDFFYELEIQRHVNSYFKKRGFWISFAADDPVATTTPITREIYVEKLVSQNRNAILDIKVDGVSVPAGGGTTLMVGNTYDITLSGKTATGYNQLESFISLSNTLFRINSVHSTFSTVSLAPPSSDLLYADSCGWDPDPDSPTYRSCIVSDGKSGGLVDVTYNLTIISGVGSNQVLSSMFYDFSGSSYHYNADYSTSARLISVIAPLGLTKTFNPVSTTPAGTSELTLTLSNTSESVASGVELNDDLTSLGMTIEAAPAPSKSAGCEAGTLTADAGTSLIKYEGGVAAAVGSTPGTCVLKVTVKAPVVADLYVNTTANVFVNGVDTLVSASATLEVADQVDAQGVCGVTVAEWKMTPGVTAENTNPPGPTTIGNVSTAVIRSSTSYSITPAITTAVTAVFGNPVNGFQATGWDKINTVDAATDQFIEFEIDTRNYFDNVTLKHLVYLSPC